MLKAYSADTIFTGKTIQKNSAVIIEDDLITEVVPLNELRSGITVIQHAQILAPAFIDIQIYGASSKLFSAYPTTDSLDKLREHCLKGGTKHFLPTIATNTFDVFKRGIDAIKEYWQKDGKGVAGLHVEGPWINIKKRGAHLENFIHSPGITEVEELLEYGKDVIKIITLAPEVCSKEVIDCIKSYNVIISAGHSNATYDEANEAFKNGIHLTTHLFNAMSPLHHREPGFPAAVMMHPSVMANIVADGFHVDFTMIHLAKKLMGERLFLITDAVTETHEGPYQHELRRDKYVANNILSGSALTMMQAVKNCIEKCDIPLDEALRMASLYPAKAIGLNHQLGKIEKGYKANFVLINENLEVQDCV